MKKRWIKERKKDFYYKEAKKEGYRSRAAFKLLQINKRYRIFKRGDFVIDLGCAPGGWLQVAKREVGPNGKVLGVDLVNVKPIKNVKTMIGDITHPEIIDSLKNYFPEGVDVILSDASPNISGNWSLDHARSVYLVEKALDIANELLKVEGRLVAKAFHGDMLDLIEDRMKDMFSFVKVHKPKASRKRSSEIYFIGKGYRLSRFL
ncbi:MAG: RlmE family RNA methyltransferase [Candidatus Hydrothermarchaeota archaeon]